MNLHNYTTWREQQLYNNCTKYNYVIIFLNIQKKLHVNNTVTRRFTISVIKTKTNSHNSTREIWTHSDAYYCGPPAFTKEKDHLNWKGLLERSVQYANFFSLQHWKFHEPRGWISFLFRVVCLAAPTCQPTASAFYSKCACFSESMCDIAKRIADGQSAQKKKITIT